MKKEKIILDNYGIAKAIARLYPEDCCILLWDDGDLVINRFTEEQEAVECAKVLDRTSDKSAFILAFKNGEEIDLKGPENVKTCWNCRRFNGNEENCDFGEKTTSREVACGSFMEDKGFPEQLSR